MSLHRLTQITMGVPNVTATAEYYTDFGLAPAPTDTTSIYGAEAPAPGPDAKHRFATVDGGEQMRLVETERRRLVELRVGAVPKRYGGYETSMRTMLDVSTASPKPTAAPPGS